MAILVDIFDRIAYPEIFIWKFYLAFKYNDPGGATAYRSVPERERS